MNLKLIMALVADEKTDEVMAAARDAGATGATVITSVRGEGLKPGKTFLGLELNAQCDVILFMVAEPKARHILETIAKAGQFDDESGAGIAMQIHVEDAVGLSTQASAIQNEIEEEL